MRNKVVSAAEATAIIREGDTVATSGFVGIGTPDELIVALERRFLETGEPRDLTLVFAAAPGDGKERGLNRLAHEGLLKRVVGGHWALVPKLGKLAVDDRIEAYNLPLGVHLAPLPRHRRQAGPALLTKVGLRTFVDPRHERRQDQRTARPRTSSALMEIDGEEWLFYKAFPINVALIRGTTADPAGNVTMEREALILDNLAMAMAAKNSRRLRHRAGRAASRPRIACTRARSWCRACWSTASSWRPPEHHLQTYATAYSPAFSRRDPRPARQLAAAAARRAQDHRPPLRLRAAAGRRGQPRHRHAGGRGGRRGRGARPRLRHAHRRARA